MKCNQCGHTLKVVRQCRRIRLKCDGCKQEYQIHEVAADLDQETEELLARYTCIIYD
jgi:DNA-directed RNA polymerase subunit M/transcription elongation factor TFIIS